MFFTRFFDRYIRTRDHPIYKPHRT
jgi:hypothetical protein